MAAVVAVCEGTDVALYDETGTEVTRWTLPNGGTAGSIAADADHIYVVSGNTLRAFDHSGVEAWGAPVALGTSYAPRRLVTGDFGVGTVRESNGNQTTFEAVPTDGSSVDGFAFSSLSDWVHTGDIYGAGPSYAAAATISTARVVDWSTQLEQFNVAGEAVAFLPDGRVVVDSTWSIQTYDIDGNAQGTAGGPQGATEDLVAIDGAVFKTNRKPWQGDGVEMKGAVDGAGNVTTAWVFDTGRATYVVDARPDGSIVAFGGGARAADGKTVVIRDGSGTELGAASTTALGQGGLAVIPATSGEGGSGTSQAHLGGAAIAAAYLGTTPVRLYLGDTRIFDPGA